MTIERLTERQRVLLISPQLPSDEHIRSGVAAIRIIDAQAERIQDLEAQLAEWPKLLSGHGATLQHQLAETRALLRDVLKHADLSRRAEHPLRDRVCAWRAANPEPHPERAHCSEHAGWRSDCERCLMACGALMRSVKP